MIDYMNLVYWNTHSWGNAFIVHNPIPKRHRWKVVIGCLLTAGTNWLIPFIIKDKIIWRYN